MIKYFLYLILDVLFMIICYLVNPIIALFVKNDGYLPNCLSWFSTHDNPADGDEYFKNKYPGNTWILKYKRTVLWLYRNTGYSFRYNILGCYIKIENLNTVHHISQERFKFMWNWDKSKSWYNRPWCLYLEIAYGYKDYAFRTFLGWKTKDLTTGQKMLAHNINPFYTIKR